MARDVFHEKIISFEPEMETLNDWRVDSPMDVKRGSIGLDNFLYKHGTHSLYWDWYQTNSLVLDREIGFQPADSTGKDTYLSTFVVWVYNETPLDDHITFQFGKDNEVNCSFDFYLHFKGWRAAWVAFERDMQGRPQPEMNRMRVLAPSKAEKGRLYFDHIILSTPSDSRYQTPDYQSPQVNAATNSHWLQLLKYSRTEPDIAVDSVLTDREKADMRTIENKLLSSLRGQRETPVNARTVARLQKKVDAYNIRIKDNKVSGRPLWFVRFTEVYERFFDGWRQWYSGIQSLDNYFSLMLDVARAYQRAADEDCRTQLAELFMRLYLHAEEQGIADGSGLGTIHHSGYSFRQYYPALHLMKETLIANGKQESAMRSMQWYAVTGEVLATPQAPGMDMDAFNTTAPGRLSSVLMMDDSPRKLAYFKSFVRWIDNGLQPSIGLTGAFKSDGAVMHHCNNYPAYGIGGIDGASLMVYLLSGTGFRVSESGHDNLKRAMLTMRFYSNTKQWPVSISGRHPRGTEALQPGPYALMALSGTPDGRQALDREMAAAYLRLVRYDSPTDDYSRRFAAAGIEPEDDPQGNVTVNYGCLNVHRRQQWMAAAHGFSRYLWAAEHYIGANYYGRYLSHGSLFIQTGPENELITNATSAYRQVGWDWNSIPGTTAIHLPIELLKANILNVDAFSGYEEMLHSDEAFAGGLSQSGENGLFAMKLHEHDKYNGSLRAHKSVFFFDDMIVCLGSDIENTNAEHPTRTTLYQNALDSDSDLTWKDGKRMEGLKSARLTSKGQSLVDKVRTGYYVAPGQQLSLSRRMQYSRDQAKDTLTWGLFALAWLEHGNAPSAAGYEYAVFPETTPERMKRMADDMKRPSTAWYEVIRKDSNLHAVADRRTRTTGYAVFEANPPIDDRLIASVDKPCLMMVRENEKEYVLTVADPDLNLYQGPSDDVYDENGKRVERSIYSRSWIADPSRVSYIKVNLKGKWQVSETGCCQVSYNEQDETQITFSCRDGLSREVILSPK